MSGDEAAAEVAAMEFAFGRSVADVAAEWERQPEWVEEAVRSALLRTIPRAAGGLKAPRPETRAARRKMRHAECEQRCLEW